MLEMRCFQGEARNKIFGSKCFHFRTLLASFHCIQCPTLPSRKESVAQCFKPLCNTCQYIDNSRSIYLSFNFKFHYLSWKVVSHIHLQFLFFLCFNFLNQAELFLEFLFSPLQPTNYHEIKLSSLFIIYSHCCNVVRSSASIVIISSFYLCHFMVYSHVHFLIGLFILLLSFENTLYILDNSPLPGMWFISILSSSLTLCPFDRFF